MIHRTKTLVLAIGLALAGVGSSHAGQSTPGKASEASIGSVVALPVISILAGASLLFGFEGQKGLLESVTNEPKPRQTKVTAVHDRGDGSRDVEVIPRDTNEGVPARVLFPPRQDGAIEPVAVGDALDFEPSPGGSGWTVHRNAGQAIAFLPTPQAQRDMASERL